MVFEIDSDEFREVLRLSHELQPWRPDEMTEYYFMNSPEWGPIPFCRECADWHYESEVHSHVREPEDYRLTANPLFLPFH